MRLINTETLEFKEFEGNRIPDYVILSHTWENEEVTYKDYVGGKHRAKSGFAKILKTCEIGKEAGYQWAWVDTCCIDKRSSAELTEAINSMYRWYMRAKVCYAFLSDLSTEGSIEDTLAGCRWFTRGWTLQELIAPNNLQFYDGEWNNRGSKKSIAAQLAQITGVAEGILKNEQSLSSVSVAHKMSWAANRETTRIEDLAYCLLGIFDVNMPLLYGEEEKAFRRLQEELIKSTADFSIFGWKDNKMPTTLEPVPRVFCGILARSPADFANCGTFTTQSTFGSGEFSITNNGVKTRVQVLIQPIPGEQGFRYVLPLNTFSSTGKSIGVRLRKCGPNIFVREDPWNILEYDEHLNPDALSDIYLLIKLPEQVCEPPYDTANFISNIRLYALQIRLPRQMYVYDAWPRGRFDDEDQLFFASENSQRDYGALRISVLAKTRIPGKDVEFEFECMFYALGWSASETESLQCTLIDYDSHAKPLNEVQSLIVDWDHSRQQVLTSLDYHRIPKTSAIAVKIPNTQRSVYMTYTPKLKRDRSICRQKFWRIEFHCEVYETVDLPSIRQEEWAVEND